MFRSRGPGHLFNRARESSSQPNFLVACCPLVFLSAADLVRMTGPTKNRAIGLSDKERLYYSTRDVMVPRLTIQWPLAGECRIAHSPLFRGIMPVQFSKSWWTHRSSEVRCCLAVRSDSCSDGALRKETPFCSCSQAMFIYLTFL